MERIVRAVWTAVVCVLAVGSPATASAALWEWTLTLFPPNLTCGTAETGLMNAEFGTGATLRVRYDPAAASGAPGTATTPWTRVQLVGAVNTWTSTAAAPSDGITVTDGPFDGLTLTASAGFGDLPGTPLDPSYLTFVANGPPISWTGTAPPPAHPGVGGLNTQVQVQFSGAGSCYVSFPVSSWTGAAVPDGGGGGLTCEPGFNGTDIDDNGTIDVCTHSTAYVDPSAVVGEGVVIGEGSIIDANSTIGAGSTIGADTTVGAFVVIEGDVEVGSNVLIGRGSVVEFGSTIEDNVVTGSFVWVQTGVWIQTGAVLMTRSVVEFESSVGAYVVIGRRVVIGASTVVLESSTFAADSGTGSYVSVGSTVVFGYGAFVSTGSTIGELTTVGNLVWVDGVVTVEPGVVLGRAVVLHSGVWVQTGTVISSGSTLWFGASTGPFVVVRSNVTVGVYTTIGELTVIGRSTWVGGSVVIQSGVRVPSQVTIVEGSYVSTGSVIVRGSTLTTTDPAAPPQLDSLTVRAGGACRYDGGWRCDVLAGAAIDLTLAVSDPQGGPITQGYEVLGPNAASFAVTVAGGQPSVVVPSLPTIGANTTAHTLRVSLTDDGAHLQTVDVALVVLAPPDCREYDRLGYGDGDYWIRPASGPDLRLACDNTHRGGGWTAWTSAFDASFATGAVDYLFVPVSSGDAFELPSDAPLRWASPVDRSLSVSRGEPRPGVFFWYIGCADDSTLSGSTALVGCSGPAPFVLTNADAANAEIDVTTDLLGPLPSQRFRVFARAR